MKIPSLLAGTCLALSLSAPSPALAIEPFLLIAKEPFAVFFIPDTPELLENWETSTPNQLMQDEKIRAFLKPSLEETDVDLPWDETAMNWTNHPLGRNLQLYQGALAVSLVLSEDLPPEEWDERPPMAIVGEIGDNVEAYEAHMQEDLEKMQEDWEDSTIDEITEDYLGVTLHLRREENEDGDMETFEGWAIVEDVAIFGYPDSVLREMVDRLQNPPAEVAWPTSWAANTDRIGLGDFFFYFDVARLEPLWLPALRKGLAEAMQSAMFGLTSESVLKALDLEALQSMALNADLTPEKIRIGVSGVLEEPSGIWGLFAYEDAPLFKPPFASRRYLSTGVASFDFAGMYDAILAMLKTASPQLATMVEAQLQIFQAQIGVDFREELLGNLGTDLWFSEIFRGSAKPGAELTQADVETDFTYVMTMENRQGVETALNTLRNFLGQGLAVFEEREYLGTTIHGSKIAMPVPTEESDDSLEGPTPQIEISYAMVDQYLLIGVGSSRTLERAIADMKDPGPSIWELDRVQQVIEELEVPPQFLEYSNVQRFAPMLLQLVEQEVDKMDEDEAFVDLEAMPEPEVFTQYLQSAVTVLYWGDDGFHTFVDLFGEAQ